MEIIARNTNELAPRAYKLLEQHGVLTTSRNGPVLSIPEPVSVCLDRPWERVNFDPVRDANPFFHLIEAMAMLAPVNNVGLMTHFAKNMKSFSDDGVRYNAFYGSRARHWGRDVVSNGAIPPFDQLDTVIKELTEKPDSRQCVVQLWDPRDLLRATVDKACNLCMIFSFRNQRLEMTTYNRSNDAVLGGISGANVVHLSFFHEYVALGIGIPMGKWWHVSNNLHAYTEQMQWQKVSTSSLPPFPYPDTFHAPLFEGPKDRATFDREVLNLMVRMAGMYSDLNYLFDFGDFENRFLSEVVVPAYNAWQLRKSGRTNDALEEAKRINAPDWSMACLAWLNRRVKS